MQGKSKHTSSNPKYYEKNYKSQDFLAYTKNNFYHSVSMTTAKRFESLTLYLSIPPKLCR